jgi:hypothetical protein
MARHASGVDNKPLVANVTGKPRSCGVQRSNGGNGGLAVYLFMTLDGMKEPS